MIDLASEQADSLGWQVREMNHLVLPHIKNAVLEAALAATQVRLSTRLGSTRCQALAFRTARAVPLFAVLGPQRGWAYVFDWIRSTRHRSAFLDLKSGQ